jgi:hypothetical protein
MESLIGLLVVLLLIVLFALGGMLVVALGLAAGDRTGRQGGRAFARISAGKKLAYSAFVAGVVVPLRIVAAWARGRGVDWADVSFDAVALLISNLVFLFWILPGADHIVTRGWRQPE